MITKLSAPYPAPKPDQTAAIAGLFMGGFVAIFLLYFRPFGLEKSPYEGAPEKILFFGVITLLCFWFLEILLPILLPGWFNDRKWRVWHRIVYYLLLLWLIASMNGLYINYINELSFNWGNYGTILIQTTALGILPVTMIVLYRYNEKMVYYLQQAAQVERTSRLTTKDHLPSSDVHNAGSNEGIFLAAEAYGNYVKVYYVSKEGWRQEVQRVTLSKLVDDLSPTGVIRCHRSFAVASGQVKSVNGNAQGLQLLVGTSGLEIPVSRTYLKAVREALT